MSECLPDFPRYISQREDGSWHGADHPDGPWRPIPAPQSGLPWPTVETDGPAVLAEATPAPFRNFDGMCWPVPCEQLDALEHCLRYDHEITHFSMKDRLLAASVIAAYLDLIQRPNIRRNAICKELRKGPGSADSWPLPLQT